MLLVLAAVALLFGMVRSAGDVREFAGTDLRARVVGARALLAGLDPYVTGTQPGLPETLRDPDGRWIGASRCTYPPTLLLVYSVVAPLAYLAQRWFWAGAEWAALVLAIAVLARGVRPARSRAAFAAFAAVFVGAGWFFRAHVERGQYYVFLALLLAAGALRLARGRGGVLLGLAAALRPIGLVPLSVLAVARERRAVLAGLLTVALAVAATLPFGGISAWRGYARIVGIWETHVVDPGSADLSQGRAPPMDPRVEGVDFHHAGEVRTQNVSFENALHLVENRAGIAPPHGLWPVLSLVGLVLATGGFAYAVFRLRRDGATRRRLAALVVLGVLAADYFAPIRWGYADVLLLVPLGLLWPRLVARRHRVAGALVAAGFVLAHDPPGLLGPEAGAWLRSAAVMGGCLLAALGRGGARARPKAE